MEVMDSRELEQKEVLIGQRGKARSMGVSDDAALMSMLSTGLYANPLRTMLQEIMFNAWDAHRMGKCQDKPFDVYLNETTGLIVRDYGPGIADAEIDLIYGTYGHSTKRDNRELTGGFGLGSKSPFAYRDSFTVTSHHQGEKNMYLVQKASDEFNGKPSITSLISGVKTEETGLMVTVALKPGDLDLAEMYIRDLVYLSGMKFNLHVTAKGADAGETKSELLQDNGLEPGAFTVNPDQRGVWAVYGGVRYEIRSDPEYEDDLQFLENMAHKVGGFFLGFPSNSLTPLPNREGLNLSDRTKENIKSRIEALYDQIQEIINPAAMTAVKFTLDQLIKSGLDEEYITYAWSHVAEGKLSDGLIQWNTRCSFDRAAFHNSEEWKELQGKCPQNVLPQIWESLLNMALFNTGQLHRLLKRTRFSTMVARVHYLRFRNPEARKDLMGQPSRLKLDKQSQTYSDLIRMRNSLAELSGQKTEIRIKTCNVENWNFGRNIRRAGKINPRLTLRREKIVKTLAAKKQLKMPTLEHQDRIWNSKDGDEVKSHFLAKTVILAKTVSALNETYFPFKEILYRQGNPDMFQILKNNSDALWYNHYQALELVPAFVIYDKKGAWEKAQEFLKAEGWTVVLADEPKEKQPSLPLEDETAVPVKQVRLGFPEMHTHLHYWGDEDIDGIEDPKVYLWVTKGQFDEYYWRDAPHPDKKLARMIKELHPKTVMLYSKTRENTLIKKGAISFAEAVDNRVKKILKNQNQIKTMYLFGLVKDRSSFPPAVLSIPQFQQGLGLPYIRSKQREAFEKNAMFLDLVTQESSEHVWSSTKKLIYQAFNELERIPEVATVQKICKTSQVFDPDYLANLVSKKRGENKILAEKILRFLRTV